jgi:flavin-dependent dehydrogenase
VYQSPQLIHSSSTYDAIVIGARCAGSPTAMLLARKGYKVLLLERAIFPGDVPRGHVIQPHGTALLKRWGLLDRVIASNCPPIHLVTLDVGPFALTSAPPLADGETPIYGPRHGILDQILAEAAVEAGAELREGFGVQDLLREGDRVIGIRGQGKDGQQVTEMANMVIGADGVHSLVARGVQAPQYHDKPNLTCSYFTYYSGLPVEGVTIYVREHRFIGVFPTNDDLACVGIQVPIAELETFRSSIEEHFLQVLELAPDLAARVRVARREERFLGAADIPNFFRKPYGPGWALVGDAGYHKDPYTGQGISDAFLGAELLSEALDAGWSGRRNLEDALFDYEQRRNEDALPKYELNFQLATLEPPPPEMQQLFGALVSNPAETARFFGTIVGTVSIPEFFEPANLQRILAESSAGVSAAR